MGPRDREFLTTTGTMIFLAAILMGGDATVHEEVFLGWLWPWWWAASGASAIAYALRPHSINLHAFSRAALTVSALSRAAQFAVSLVIGTTPDDRILRTLAGICVYLLLARLIYRQWMTLMPLPEDRRARRR